MKLSPAKKEYHAKRRAANRERLARAQREYYRRIGQEETTARKYETKRGDAIRGSQPRLGQGSRAFVS